MLTDDDKMIYAFMGGKWQPVSKEHSNTNYTSWAIKYGTESACQKACDRINKHALPGREAVALPINRGIITGFTLPYASNWSWLMCVVEKIESVPVFEGRLTDSRYIVSIESTYCIISVDGEAPQCEINNDTKIESVYAAVVAFIKWYTQYV